MFLIVIDEEIINLRWFISNVKLKCLNKIFEEYLKVF